MIKYLQSIIFIGNNTNLENSIKTKFSIDSIDTTNLLQIKRKVGKKSIGIEEIETLKEFTLLKGYNRNFKLIIIEDGELLTIPAQNSLLKLLEEPNPNTQIIIRCNKDPNFLNTVTSRCTTIREINDQELNSNNPLSNLLNLPFYKRIESLNELISERDSFIKNNNIENLFNSITEKLLLELEMNIGNYDKISELQQKIKKVTEIRQKIRQNVNIKLSLDNLALIGNIP